MPSSYTEEKQNNSIGILSYNVAFFPLLNAIAQKAMSLINQFSPQHISNALPPQNVRARKIVNKILEKKDEIQVIGMQEVWNPDAANYFQKSLSEDYYVIRGIEPHDSNFGVVKLVSGGLLMCISKKLCSDTSPPERLVGRVFGNAMLGEETFGRKGVTIDLIHLKNSKEKLVLIHTHLHANGSFWRKLSDWSYGKPGMRRNQQMNMINQELEKVEKQLAKQYPDVEIHYMLMGDFNVPLDNQNKMLSINRDSRVKRPGQYELFSKFIFQQPVNVRSKYDKQMSEKNIVGTFIGENNIDSGHIIDGIFSHQSKQGPALSTRALVLEEGLSDHHPILGTLDLSRRVERLNEQYKVTGKVVPLPKPTSYPERVLTSMGCRKKTKLQFFAEKVSGNAAIVDEKPVPLFSPALSGK